MTLPSQHWIEFFPGLADVEEPLRANMLARCLQIKLPGGTRIFGPGHTPEQYLLLLEGSIKVQQFSESGRAIVLYHIATGESCIMTTACLIGHEAYSAEALTEKPCRAVALPRVLFNQLMAQSEQFRRFVFAGFSHRLTEMFHLIENVAFVRMEVRLAQKLLALSPYDSELAITHQQIATELGSAREVVSRMLSELQRRGWIKSSRGRIQILDRPALVMLLSEK